MQLKMIQSCNVDLLFLMNHELCGVEFISVKFCGIKPDDANEIMATNSWKLQPSTNHMLACRNVVVAGVRCAGRGRKTWYECVKDDMKVLGLHAEWAVFRDVWRGFISGGMSNPS